MPSKKPKRPKQPRQPPVKIPMSFDAAVGGLLQVKPPKPARPEKPKN